jgi:outer membrane protein assembly factor BamB
LVLTFDGIDQQYVTALDTRTGKTVWRTDRSTDYHDLGKDGKPAAEGDNRKSYGTPSTIEAAGRTQLLSVGARAAFGYDIETGREIWTVTHADFNASAPPLVYGNLAIIHTGSGGTNLFAVRVDESTRGNVTGTHLAWDRTKGNARLCAPALDHGRVWTLTAQGVLYVVDAKTGQQLAGLRLGGAFVASPVIAGDHLYACDEEEGITMVVRTSLPPKVVAKNRLSEGMRASPAVADGAIYLRTFHSLYKIAGAEAAAK